MKYLPRNTKVRIIEWDGWSGVGGNQTGKTGYADGSGGVWTEKNETGSYLCLGSIDGQGRSTKVSTVRVIKEDENMSRFKVGDEVMAIGKTAGLRKSPLNCNGYVLYVDDNNITVNSDKGSVNGDYYRESDLIKVGEVMQDTDGLFTKVFAKVEGKFVIGNWENTYEEAEENSEQNAVYSLDRVKQFKRVVKNEFKEVTLSEVAKAMGVSVDKLRIKD